MTRCRGPLAALVLGAALAPLLGGAATAAGPVRTPAAPTPLPSAGRAALTVSELTPRAPRPGQQLQVTAVLTNGGDERLRDLQVRVRVGARLASRGALDRADAAPSTYTNRAVQAVPDVEAGAQAAVSVQVAVDDLRLSAAGVYPLQLEMRGVRGSAGARETLDAVSTYLPWFGGGTVDPVRIAWLWPLADQPRLGPDDIMVDDELASSLAPTGRLGSSLAVARSSGTAVPVTYAVDPDLLYTVRAMTRSYPVRTDGSVQDGAGVAAAQAWLPALQTAPGDVVALPYADPDVVALTRGAAELAADVSAGRTYGETVTQEVLGRPPLRTVAYPPPGPLSDAALDTLTTGGASTVVLGSDAVHTPDPGASSTPSARVELPSSSTAGPVTGLVVDRALSDLLARGSPDGPRIAEQRWLVETAMISAELPSRGRTLIVALPRRAAPDPAVVTPALADTASMPWMCAVSLASVVASAERCAGAAVPAYTADNRVDLLQPDAKSPSLSSGLVAELVGVRAAATQLTGSVVLGGTAQSQALRSRLQRAWLRGESSAWREDRSAGLRLIGQLRSAVTDLRAKVSVVTGRITLTSNNGRVSVLVVNDLDQAVTVSVRLRASSDARLSRTQSDLLAVPAHNSLPVQVDARTSTSGRFIVKAQLLDRDGVAFGDAQDLLVRSTRYGAVALAVTGLGAAVLLVAAGIRVVRRALPALRQ